ncbi:MAG: HEAT repeat domain-containing protein [Armatimonadetes bacterium]|nr:HEAT repeat domain-containing protein [Armatimonadota bacterium]
MGLQLFRWWRRGQSDREAVLGRLLADLGRRNERRRLRAAEQLGALGDRRAVEPLICALHDPGSGVRSAAAAALGRLGDARAGEALISAGRAQRLSRSMVVCQLIAIGDERASLALEHLLTDDDSISTWMVDQISGLGFIAVAPLIRVLDGASLLARVRAVMALGAIRDQRVITPLVELMLSDNGDLVVRAGEALARQGAAALPGLAQVLHGGREYARLWAIRAMAAIGDERAVEPLRLVLDRGTTTDRVEAAKALGQLGDDGSARRLRPLLQSRDWQEQEAAAFALGVLGDYASVPRLVDLVVDGHMAARIAAARALGQLGHADAVGPVCALLMDLQSDSRSDTAKIENARLTVERALGQLGASAAVVALREVLGTHTREEDNYILLQLARLGDHAGREEIARRVARGSDYSGSDQMPLACREQGLDLIDVLFDAYRIRQRDFPHFLFWRLRELGEEGLLRLRERVELEQDKAFRRNLRRTIRWLESSQREGATELLHAAAPEGVGTELLSADAVEGSGTELEAEQPGKDA